MEQVNVADQYTSHEQALTWALDTSSIDKQIAFLEMLLTKVDGRANPTPQAKWARDLLRPTLKNAKTHLAARQKAAADVEPFREAFRDAIGPALASNAAIESAATPEALIHARADAELKGRALGAARGAFADAITRSCAGKSEPSATGDVHRAWCQDDEAWGTTALAKVAHEIGAYAIGYHCRPFDWARKQGAGLTVPEMIVAACKELPFLDFADCVATFAIRWERFAQRNGIALEQAQAGAA